MIFSSPTTIEEHILSVLSLGTIKTTDLIERVNSLRPNTTKQAVYAALRNLRKEEVVIAHGMKTSLNVRWLNSVEKYLKTALQQYNISQTGQGNFYTLKNKERIEYYFNDLLETDAFWWQALYQFINSSTSGEPVYIYNPHEWFLIARRESELEVIDTIIKKNKQLLLTVGNNSALDKYIAQDFNGESSQYYMSPQPLFKKNNYYLNVVDDFLIEVWINQDLANAVENIYQRYSGNIDSVTREFKDILTRKSKGRLVISRNIKKAERIKKKLRKHFYIKK